MLRKLGLYILGFLAVVGPATPCAYIAADQPKKERHYLYAVVPGIRNYLEFGGAGIVVFDIDNGHKFVKRIATPASKEEMPDNIKGVCACAVTKKLYFTNTKKLYCVDLATDKTLWDKTMPGGCDRMSITPDGKTIYCPSFERDHWNVVDAATGDVVETLFIQKKDRAHNTICSIDGKQMFLAGIGNTTLPIADAKTHKIVAKVGPFSAGIRPFTVNGAGTLVYCNVNELLGFEIGDVKTGKILHRVEVTGVKQGPVKRHGCPSHGVGMTPDEKEVWCCDGHNSMMHVFDNTVMPPKQIASIKVREQPGWVTFSLDGKYAYPSTGDVIEVKTKKTVTGLTDEKGGEVHSEKVVEIVFADGTVIGCGDQFGLGRQGAKPK
ncbi:MAG TPA: hypothetical protein VE988_26065 [Gemmataceae bacterium]|nr:hypothetical protein [Gemmataceae bacterium]